MTLADKRKAIEVLLCASGDQWAPSLHEAADEIDVGLEIARAAVRARGRMAASHGHSNRFRYHHDCCGAAYRLIESSPTLRREWFGAR